MASYLKAESVTVFDRQTLAALSDVVVDCTKHNAVSVEVCVSGATPSATVSVEGGPEPSSQTLPLIDPNAVQSAVTANKIFDVIVGSAWVRARIANISGSFLVGQGFTVKIVPYISPGPTSLVAMVS